MKARLKPLHLRADSTGLPDEPCSLLRASGVKPCIQRVARHLTEILVPEDLEPKARDLLREAGYTLLELEYAEPGEGSLEEIVKLIREERFHEAHIASEKLMSRQPRVGRILALYTAVLVKRAEGLERAVRHLLGLLESVECVSRVVDLECLRRIAFSGEPPSGEAAASCVKLGEVQ